MAAGIGSIDRRLTGYEMSTPYKNLPPYTRWSKSVAGVAYCDVDPVVSFPFKIEASDRVATAGSCFAQHIARHLRIKGFNYYVVEPGHPLGDDTLREEFNYGAFSARYGNIYTARQLLQTIRRAFDHFIPKEEIWAHPEGGFADPFRPAIQPRGFPTREELLEDRKRHLRVVKKMFSELDIFVFTLGLTEAWQACSDGAILPVCPGVSGGEFSSERYEFVNFGFRETLDDMRVFINFLREINSNAKIVLTVSPVPLIATAEPRHVLVSTTYSKSVLRAVCEDLTQSFDNVAYFPSYEIITGNYTRGRYFAEDLRSITEEGVEHVMRLFIKHCTSFEGEAPIPTPEVSSNASFLESMKHVVRASCEEELLESSLRQSSPLSGL
jgi:hypothetical protein